MSTGKSPYVYLDTNVILDVIRGRKTESTNIMEKVKKRKIKACTSLLCLLELIDKEQEHYFESNLYRDGYSFDEILRIRNQRNLSGADLLKAFNKVDRLFVIPYKEIIDFVYLEGPGWDKAVELMQTLNLRSNDAIHLATALVMKCDLLVADDKHFLENALKVIPVSLPENIDEKLKELGF